MDQFELQITKLDRLPIPDIQPLVDESRAQSYKFIDRLVDEYTRGINTFYQPGEALFGVFADRRLVAIGGLNRDPYLPGSDTGRVRHVYVLAAWRRQGIGKLLVQRIIAEARQHFRRLTLRTLDAQADAFYRAIGFQARDDIPSATHYLVLTEE